MLLKARCATSAPRVASTGSVVAGDVQLDRFFAVVGERQATNLGRMFRRNDDLGDGFDRSVAALQLHAIDGERSVVIVWRRNRRLLPAGPKPAMGEVADVDEDAARLQLRVVTKTCDVHALPGQNAGSGGRHDAGKLTVTE